jgi:DNA polymerase (family 10)
MRAGSAMRTNAEIAEALQRIADLLEIRDENPFRIRAYRTAARTVAELPEGIAAMLARGEDLTELPSIGKDLAKTISELAHTGRTPLLDRLSRRLPGDLAEMMRLPALGPKRVALIHDMLHVRTLSELRAAAAAGRLRVLPGIGEKTEQKILASLQGAGRGGEKRVRLAMAEQIAESLLAYLRSSRAVERCVVAGSFRRRRESVGDLDVLVVARDAGAVTHRFVEYEDVAEVLSHGSTRSSVVLQSGIQVDLRVVEPQSYGAALVYFTGSKAHNIELRKIAVTKKLKINEYGVFRGNARVAGETEESVYRRVGLRFVEPELRENRGEIDAARRGRLPKLVTGEDLRGDLHVHTDATDGENTIAEMAAAAEKRGYRYIAITDHTKRLAMVHGQTAARLRRQCEKIDALNAKLRGFTVLKSAEVDILGDGSLDLPDEILAELDFTVCSIHYQFALSEEKQTERVLRAMDSPYFTVFGHPTGRLIGEREPYAIDLERVLRAARERGCVLEVNAQPDRLDLSDLHCRLAKEMGVKLAIVTDAHRTSDYDKIRFGIDQARRGWIEPSDVINTRPLAELRRLLRRHR